MGLGGMVIWGFLLSWLGLEGSWMADLGLVHGTVTLLISRIFLF